MVRKVTLSVKIQAKVNFEGMGAKPQYQSVLWVTIGTTLGMLIANVPIIYVGKALLQRIPLKTIRAIAASVFVILGIHGLMTIY